MKFDVPSAKIDQISLNDEGDGQTTLTYDNIQASNFVTAKQDASDRLVLGSSPCSFYWAPDYRKITDIEVRKALAYAYPYQEAWAAGGEIVGVTREPGTNMMPPGIPERTEYNPLPDHEPGTTDADKAKQLLAGLRQRELPDPVPVRAGRPDLGGRQGRHRQGPEGRLASTRSRTRPPSRTTPRCVPTPTRRSTSGPPDGALTGRPVARGSRRCSSRPT